MQRNHLRLRRIVAAGFLIQLADACILNMHLRNALHGIRWHQILAAQLGNRAIGIGAQNLVIRLIHLFQLLIRSHALDGIGVAVFIDQHILTVVLFELQIDARQRATIFVRLGDNHAINHLFVDLHVHVPGNDSRQFRIRARDIAYACTRALVFVIDPHMRHQHNGVDLPLELLDSLFHRVNRVSKVQPFHPVGAFSELGGHRGIHTDNANFHALTFNDFRCREIRFSAVP